MALGTVAEVASRLGIIAREVPASVDIVDKQMMIDQGYRTTTEVAQGAPGVLSGDAAGAPAGYSMRGFDFSQINILYNDIYIGPQSFTSRVMDTFVLDRVEFLKGPSSLMSGIGATGGAVNYVNKSPTSGPVKNEVFSSVDSFGRSAPGSDRVEAHPLQVSTIASTSARTGSTTLSMAITRISRTSPHGSIIARRAI